MNDYKIDNESEISKKTSPKIDKSDQIEMASAMQSLNCEDLIENFPKIIIEQGFSNSTEVILAYADILLRSPSLFISKLKEQNIIKSFPAMTQESEHDTQEISNLLLLGSILAEINQDFSLELCEKGYFELCLKFLSERQLSFTEISMQFISAVLLHPTIARFDFEFDVLFDSMQNVLRFGTYTKQWCCRALYGFVLNCKFQRYFENIINIAERIRNTADDSDIGTSCDWIAKLCTVLLQINPNYLKILEWGQLLGGLVETLEQQYVLQEFTPVEESFQFDFFRFLNQVIKSTDMAHAARLAEMVSADFYAKVIETSAFEVVHEVLQIITFLFQEGSSEAIKVCISQPYNIRLIVDRCFGATYQSKVIAVRLVHEILRQCRSESIINMLLAFEYFEKVTEIYSDQDSLGYILGTCSLILSTGNQDYINTFSNSSLANLILEEEIDDDIEEYEALSDLRLSLLTLASLSVS